MPSKANSRAFLRSSDSSGTRKRGGATLAGIAAGAGIIERGPVHGLAKLNAKVETAIGTRVVKIVDRIVKGWEDGE
ncbi:hypothetical protein HY949_02045 [Candidatus Gottesmanbacteria bacterium]|nr:hypothetical protein [Candidatus Gottesmanbacteria bacterium]